MRRLGFLVVMLMLVGSIGVAIALSSAEREPSVGAGESAHAGGSSLRPTPHAPPEVATPASVPFGERFSSNRPSRTGQSRLWFHDGAWWGVFLTARSQDHRIHRLDAATQRWVSTDVTVDDRVDAQMDVMPEGDSIVVASAGVGPDPSNALRISRLSFDPSIGTYTREPSYPVTISAVGVEGATVTRADDGRLWVAYEQDSRLVVGHSVSSDLEWADPFIPDVADTTIEEVAIAAVGGRVGLVWTQPSDDAVFIAWHDTGDSERVWQAGASAPLAGLRFGEDDLSVATDASDGVERLFAAVKTSAELDPAPSVRDPQVVLIEFRPDADPTSYLFGRVADHHAGPIVLVDRTSRELIVVAAAPKAGGAIYYKTTSLDDISFPTGLGSVLIAATDQHPRLARATSTKQQLDDDTGMVVGATDAVAGIYGFGALDLGARSAAEPSPSGSPAPLLTAGMITSPEELAALPMRGPAWDRMKRVADGDLGTPSIADINGTHDTATLAVALVYGRTGDESYRQKAADAIMSAIGTEDGGLASNVGRNLISYVIAADLIGFASFDPRREAEFRRWLTDLRFERFSDGSIVSEDRKRANNHGRLAGASRLAASLYLGDRADFLEAIAIFKGWLGDRSSYNGFTWRNDLSWQADPSNPVGINPAGATKDGFSIDGAQPEEMRRGCAFTVPPCPTRYPWENSSAVFLVAEILDRQGYEAWEWEDRALLRAAEFLHDLEVQYGGWWAEGDDVWQPWLINHAYGTSYPTEPVERVGKTFAWSDWLWGPGSAAR